MARYSCDVFVGNWLNDRACKQERQEALAHSLSQRDTETPQQIEDALRPTTTEATVDDDLLHYGDTFVLESIHTKGFLSCNPLDKMTETAEPSFEATASTEGTPIARNTLRLLPFSVDAQPAQPSASQPVRYGDAIAITVNASSSSLGPLYLCSEIRSPVRRARVTRSNQIAGFAPVFSSGALWQVLHINPTKRLGTEVRGDPVPVEEPVILRHMLTASSLASNGAVFRNEFGIEHEVSTHEYVDQYHLHTSPNHWIFRNRLL